MGHFVPWFYYIFNSEPAAIVKENTELEINSFLVDNTQSMLAPPCVEDFVMDKSILMEFLWYLVSCLKGYKNPCTENEILDLVWR
jgi:hypothetical protein